MKCYVSVQVTYLLDKNAKANWMVSNSAKLDCRTKQHTEFGVSVSNGSTDMGWTKVAKKKEKKKEKKKREHLRSHKASPTGIANEEGKNIRT